MWLRDAAPVPCSRSLFNTDSMCLNERARVLRFQHRRQDAVGCYLLQLAVISEGETLQQGREKEKVPGLTLFNTTWTWRRHGSR